MVTKNFIFKILPILYVLLKTASSGSLGHGVLSKLYQKAVNEHRPLVLVLDSDNGPVQQQVAASKPFKSRHVVHKHVKQTNDLSNVAEDQIGDNEIHMLKALVKKLSALVSNTASKKTKAQRPGLRTKEDLMTPLIKSLLRVSNDMNCVARDECVEKGEKEDKCEAKFECEAAEHKKDKQDECAVEDADECGVDELQSTKGYTLEPADNTCTRC